MRLGVHDGCEYAVGPLFCRNRSARVGGDKIKVIPKRRPVI